ncbi:hypothetical protein LIA77_10167 [Sarocladium implicatum]|nr:hypothetical protein LIA77_10167 [Sarocladium implicatum]
MRGLVIEGGLTPCTAAKLGVTLQHGTAAVRRQSWASTVYGVRMWIRTSGLPAFLQAACTRRYGRTWCRVEQLWSRADVTMQEANVALQVRIQLRKVVSLVACWPGKEAKMPQPLVTQMRAT